MKFFISSILFISICIKSEGSDKDSLRIKKFPDYIHYYTKVGPSFSQVEIRNPNLSKNLILAPSPQSLFGFGFSYSWIGLGVSFTIPSTEEETRKYGRTKKFDFEAHYTMRKLMVDLTLKRYKGFYVDNPDKYIDNWNYSDPYPQAPNLKTVSLAASVAYIFRPDKYSSNAAYTYSNAMRKSGGSWMAGGFFSINGVESDSSIVPYIIRQNTGLQFELKEVVFSNIGASFGYSHLFTIFKKNFVAFTFLPGFAFQKTIQYSSVDGEEKIYKTISPRTILRLALGRNGDKYYSGISAYLESSSFEKLNSKLLLTSGHIEIFFGYRINTGNWKFMKKVDQLIHPQFLRFAIGDPPKRE